MKQWQFGLGEKLPDNNIERILRLDNLKRNKGFQILQVISPLKQNGVFQLERVDDTFEFLLFGGGSHSS